MSAGAVLRAARQDVAPVPVSSRVVASDSHSLRPTPPAFCRLSSTCAAHPRHTSGAGRTSVATAVMHRPGVHHARRLASAHDSANSPMSTEDARVRDAGATSLASARNRASPDNADHREPAAHEGGRGAATGHISPDIERQLVCMRRPVRPPTLDAFTLRRRPLCHATLDGDATDAAADVAVETTYTTCSNVPAKRPATAPINSDRDSPGHIGSGA